MTDAVVRADGVTKRWGATVALDEATFEIGSGITGLLGANGAGKTTMLGLVLGLYRPETTASARRVEARLRVSLVRGMHSGSIHIKPRSVAGADARHLHGAADQPIRSERIVPDRGHDDVVVGRNITPDSHEGFTFDVLVLGAERHAAIISLVDILPEARRYFG